MEEPELDIEPDTNEEPFQGYTMKKEEDDKNFPLLTTFSKAEIRPQFEFIQKNIFRSFNKRIFRTHAKLIQSFFGCLRKNRKRKNFLCR